MTRRTQSNDDDTDRAIDLHERVARLEVSIEWWTSFLTKLLVALIVGITTGVGGVLLQQVLLASAAVSH